MNDEININEQLDILEETKSQIKQAIIDKGQSVSSSDSFRSYATKIGNIEVLNAQSKPVTPTTQQQIIEPDAPTYNGLSQVTVAGVTSAIDSNIQASNIKNGVTILGVQGTYSGTDTSDANATASNIEMGKTAYVNGTKITGSLQPVDSTHPAQNIDPINVTGHTMMMSNIFILQATCDTSGVGALILKDNDPIYIAVQEPVLAGLISLTAGKIKSGETILGITGTYSDAMKSYNSETAMNNDIANIQEGEVVKVVVTSGIAGDVDNPLTTTITHYIKETTMKKLVKEEDTLSPADAQQAETQVGNLLGEEETE